MDPNLILAKAGSVRQHLSRVIEKRDVDLNGFINDVNDLNEFLKAISKKLRLTH